MIKFSLLVRALTILLCLTVLIGCDENQKEQRDEPVYFLRDIRPIYFDHLNFESESVKAKTASFLRKLSSIYEQLEFEHKSKGFKSSEDLENMRLAGMYYSFYLLALGGNFMDGNIDFTTIQGDYKTGLYTSLPLHDPNYRMQELHGMMQRAKEVSKLAYGINGFNDQAYGFYLSVRQVQERLKTKGFVNNAETQDSVITYVGTRMVNFDLLPDWNILMSMVTFSNYADSLNTFKNPNMDMVLFNVNARLMPGELEDLGGLFPEILGPIYRFDLNLKKIDWLLSEYEVLEERQIKDLDSYITILDIASHFVETEKRALLESWHQKETFEVRKEKMAEVKAYRAKISAGSSTEGRPQLGEYLNSHEFKKAYQCYSCHKSSGYNR